MPVYLLGWCFLQHTSPVGLRVKPSHNSRLSFPNSRTPSVTLRPLTITTHILAFTYKNMRERYMELQRRHAGRILLGHDMAAIQTLQALVD